MPYRVLAESEMRSDPPMPKPVADEPAPTGKWGKVKDVAKAVASTALSARSGTALQDTLNRMEAEGWLLHSVLPEVPQIPGGDAGAEARFIFYRAD